MRRTVFVATTAVLLSAAAVVAAPPQKGTDEDEAARVARAILNATDFTRAEPFEARPGGAATHFKTPNRNAFSLPSANMSFARRADFNVGNGLFRRVWVTAPSSTQAADGLGPLFNARSCQRCHLKDGRGHPPKGNFPEDTAVSMFLRLSIPPQTEADKALLASRQANVIPDPTYGGQLQDFAIPGHAAEGRMHITYEDVPVELDDGTVVTLQKPSYKITDLGYGPPHPELMMSPRVAPQMIGLGLLEAIAEDDILANADPDDADGDGVSGRPNIVWDGQAGRTAVGRFGWKAGNPTVTQQSAGAFAGDIGIGNPLAPNPWGDCTEAQTACRQAPHGNTSVHDDAEVSGEALRLVVFYARNLAVPARRGVDDPDVLAGKRLFYDSGCVACHRPKYVTARRDDMPEQSFQLIWPYTDLLLHDMGDGLADGRPEGVANGREWRTAPLWGIGLTQTVNGHSFLLHDGRARGVLEAILWHGGEAEATKRAVMALSAEERRQLVAFVESL